VATSTHQKQVWLRLKAHVDLSDLSPKLAAKADMLVWEERARFRTFDRSRIVISHIDDTDVSAQTASRFREHVDLGVIVRVTPASAYRRD
jgi:hypothetical protein